jgi:hypothetical protein
MDKFSKRFLNWLCWPAHEAGHALHRICAIRCRCIFKSWPALRKFMTNKKTYSAAVGLLFVIVGQTLINHRVVGELSGGWLVGMGFAPFFKIMADVIRVEI